MLRSCHQCGAGSGHSKGRNFFLILTAIRINSMSYSSKSSYCQLQLNHGCLQRGTNSLQIYRSWRACSGWPYQTEYNSSAAAIGVQAKSRINKSASPMQEKERCFFGGIIKSRAMNSMLSDFRIPSFKGTLFFNSALYVRLESSKGGMYFAMTEVLTTAKQETCRTSILRLGRQLGIHPSSHLRGKT